MITFIRDPILEVGRDERLYREVLDCHFDDHLAENFDDWFPLEDYRITADREKDYAEYRASIIDACVATKDPLQAMLRCISSDWPMKAAQLAMLESYLGAAETTLCEIAGARAIRTGHGGPLATPGYVNYKGQSVLGFQPERTIELGHFYGTFVHNDGVARTPAGKIRAAPLMWINVEAYVHEADVTDMPILDEIQTSFDEFCVGLVIQ